MADSNSALLRSLDFIYSPSRDVAGDLEFLTTVLGGRVVFAIEEMGTRVAMIDLTGGQPKLLLVDHLAGDRPVLGFRVDDLEGAMSTLGERGWTRERVLEIPQGPCCSFQSPGGQRVAIYMLTRPGVIDHFQGRRDF